MFLRAKCILIIMDWWIGMDGSGCTANALEMLMSSTTRRHWGLSGHGADVRTVVPMMGQCWLSHPCCWKGYILCHFVYHGDACSMVLPRNWLNNAGDQISHTSHVFHAINCKPGCCGCHCDLWQCMLCLNYVLVSGFCKVTIRSLPHFVCMRCT